MPMLNSWQHDDCVSLGEASRYTASAEKWQSDSLAWRLDERDPTEQCPGLCFETVAENKE